MAAFVIVWRENICTYNNYYVIHLLMIFSQWSEWCSDSVAWNTDESSSCCLHGTSAVRDATEHDGGLPHSTKHLYVIDENFMSPALNSD